MEDDLQFERHDVFDARHKKILLAEDNPADIELFKEVCESSKYPCSIYIVNDGGKAVKFLKSGVERPDIIVLDINMPVLNGIEVLEQIKGDSNFAGIPRIMLTSSKLSPDIERAKEQGANGYLLKPVSFNISELMSFIDLVKTTPDIFLDFSQAR